MSEFNLIDSITRGFLHFQSNIVKGIGDDCAVWSESSGLRVLTTDSMIEGDHFLKTWFSPEQIGHRFLMSNVSDVAAMGASPLFLFVALVLDDATSLEWVERLYNGMRPVCAKHHISLLGGNVTHGKTLSLTATLVGESPDKVVYRNGASVGDVLVVTGDIGSACAARLLLKNGKRAPSELFERLACPTARVEEGVYLKAFATSMIDISDGIASEARHLAQQSGCGVEVMANLIPLRSDVSLECALRGGEDYELMFTVSVDHWGDLQMAWPFDTKITAIGTMTEGSEYILIQNGQSSPLPRGFDHLSENINL